MACHTDCIEKPISNGFGHLGGFVGKHPWWFFIIPLLISAGLGAGFYFLEDREANEIEDQFTPMNGPAKKDRQFVQENFKTDDFSRQRLSTEGTYASLIIASKQNVLTEEAFNKIIELDRTVRDITVGTDEKITFNDICAITDQKCVSNAILDIVNYTASKIEVTKLTFPFYTFDSKPVFLGTTIGGVEMDTTEQIKMAKAVRLDYFLSESNSTESDLWLKEFIRKLSKVSATNLEPVSVSYFTSISRQEEFISNSKSVIPLFSVAYFLAITFSIISCSRLDCVRTKVWVANVGVLSAGLAVLSSFGLLLFCGMPFVMTVATAPFLILGIGVDDMFIMVSCWQRTHVHDRVEERMADTYREAAVSITITTLTDVLAFYIGLMTPFGSVQSFCMYTGTAILFCYLYNITFFGAFLALNGRREASNRHWLSCMEVPEVTDIESSQCSRHCCKGGAYDPNTGNETDTPFNTFFKKYYGKFVTKPWTKAVVVILYLGYLAASIYGCLQMQEGIQLKNLATDGSYVGSFYDDEDAYFSDYGPNVMVVVKGEFPYWDKTSWNNLDVCLDRFENLTKVKDGMLISWLQAYESYGKQMSLNLTDENTFKEKLPSFLRVAGFQQDVNFTNDKIYASRFFIQTINIVTPIDEKNILNELRETADECEVPLLVYHPAFIYFDQYAVIVTNTIQNILVATAAMLVISLLLIPSPLCSLWVSFAIASVIVGVAGFMALWDVNLDSISMINLVICIGFSVDFSAHISYAFVSSNESTANGKACDALYSLGYPIVQGAVSTILGVVVLAAAESYILRTFFKIMFLVILFGAVHGIMFIPVFLTFFGICSSSDKEDNQNMLPDNSSSECMKCDMKMKSQGHSHQMSTRERENGQTKNKEKIQMKTTPEDDPNMESGSNPSKSKGSEKETTPEDDPNMESGCNPSKSKGSEKETTPEDDPNMESGSNPSKSKGSEKETTPEDDPKTGSGSNPSKSKGSEKGTTPEDDPKTGSGSNPSKSKGSEKETTPEDDPKTGSGSNPSKSKGSEKGTTPEDDPKTGSSSNPSKSKGSEKETTPEDDPKTGSSSNPSKSKGSEKETTPEDDPKTGSGSNPSKSKGSEKGTTPEDDPKTGSSSNPSKSKGSEKETTPEDDPKTGSGSNPSKSKGSEKGTTPEDDPKTGSGSNPSKSKGSEKETTPEDDPKTGSGSNPSKSKGSEKGTTPEDDPKTGSGSNPSKSKGSEKGTTPEDDPKTGSSSNPSKSKGSEKETTPEDDPKTGSGSNPSKSKGSEKGTTPEDDPKTGSGSNPSKSKGSEKETTPEDDPKTGSGSNPSKSKGSEKGTTPEDDPKTGSSSNPSKSKGSEKETTPEDDPKTGSGSNPSKSKGSEKETTPEDDPNMESGSNPSKSKGSEKGTTPEDDPKTGSGSNPSKSKGSEKGTTPEDDPKIGSSNNSKTIQQ